MTTDNYDQLVNAFLEKACADPILANGPAAHVRRANTALRILKRYPEIARDSIHTALLFVATLTKLPAHPRHTT